MATTATYKAYPAAAAGISRASSGSTAWSTSSAYTELVPVNTITSEFNIAGITLMYNFNDTVDTTIEVEIDIATGASSSEVVIITVPFCYRIDSAVGHHPVIFIPISEPRTVAANTRLSVRVRQSVTTSITYAGIKIMYF
jgi:hypothetical protein